MTVDTNKILQKGTLCKSDIQSVCTLLKVQNLTFTDLTLRDLKLWLTVETHAYVYANIHNTT